MEKKKCCTCKEWKDLDCFGKNRSTKDGYQKQCKDCRRRYQKKIKNKTQLYKKEYYKKNKKNVDNKNRLYYQNNKPEILKYKKEWSNLSVIFDSKYRKEIEVYEDVRESKEGYLECKCAYCGDWFIPTFLSIRSRLRSINNNNKGECRLYCSQACKQACPTYKKLLYPKGFKPATSREVQPELRQMVLARDNYTCQRCNKHKDEKDVALHCHHLEGIQWEPLESADMDMCITYCQPCHVKAHQQPDCSYNDMQCI